jgi:hypothetical protein
MAMADHSIPATPDAITPGWLTETLRSSGRIGQAAVEAVEVEKIAVGYGFLGQYARLHLQYDRNDTGAPTELFAKLSSESRQVRDRLAPTGLYETEVGFYRDLAESTPLRVPRPYACLYDQESFESVVLLEDLSTFRFGDNIAGCSPQEAFLIIRTLARMHARFWNDPGLCGLRWLRSPREELVFYQPLYKALLPEFERRYLPIIPSPLLAAMHGLSEWGETLIENQCRQPYTLVHGDFRLDNFAFAGSGTETELIVFDWNVARRAPGARDLSYLLAFSLPVEQRRVTERSLLEAYHETLLAEGVKGYGLDDLLAHYRIALFSPLARMVIACATLDFSSDRGTKLVRFLGERIAALVEDYDFAGIGKAAYGKA